MSFLSIAYLSTPEGVALVMVSLTVFGFFFQESVLSMGVFLDPMSWSIVTLSLLVSSMVIFTSTNEATSITVPISVGLIVVVSFFSTDSIVSFFVMFEMSLVPLIFLVLSWGRQAERLLATQFMLIYTIVASCPLFLFTLWKVGETGSPSIYLSSLTSSNFGGITFGLSLIAFFVNIPVFLFHSWLPKAHVEAPLEGSIILAGIMLKVGTFGLVRIIMVLNLTPSFSELIFSISLIGSLISSLVALSSDDINMSVAFSSISHINMVVASIFSIKLIGVVSSVIIMVAHGLGSPLLFYLVTNIYLSTHSRSMLVSKGVLSNVPFLWLIGLLVWVINISPPPFLPFIGEVLGFSSILSFLPWSILWIVLFMVVGSFYSIVNFGVQSHSSLNTHIKSGQSDFLFPLLCLVVVSVSLEMFIFQPPLWG